MGWVGKSIPRKEDARLIRGQGRFVDDQHSTDMLHLHLLRSPYSHAKIISIDVSKAEALPGVVCTLTGDELAAQSQPFLELGEDPGAKITDYAMAVGKVRYQGEPVVAIVAETPPDRRRRRGIGGNRLRDARRGYPSATVHDR